MRTLTDEDFAEAVRTSATPLLVEFSAVWCGPCRMIEPALEEIAAERAGSLDVVKIDIDRSPRAARDTAVMSAPTLVLYRDGEAVARTVGARPKAQLLALIDDALEAAAR
jgi:thioredoxin 1